MKDTGSQSKPSKLSPSSNRRSWSAIGPMVQNFIFGLGIFLVILSGGLIVTYISEIIAGESKHPLGSQLGLITFLFGIVFVGCKLIKVKLDEKKALKELKEEQLILSHAKSRAMALTVSESSLECQLSIADTKKAFDRLTKTGVCTVDVSDEGELCYRFPSFENRLQAQNSDSHAQTIDCSVPQHDILMEK